ncbi:hypothetical protein LT330_005881 [Penicillium expansum]|uniref:MARVEL domain-containing protein n=1 Tax=Penicillium expansum TaxID=27334 RepID=A0A0A2IQ69_PENEN|nr:hypothetical protein PEX2_097880 [Penicillium expansum]KAK4869499.1 hypothetical protein LT330_005881 [Penicillium expansum]KGO44499.1 hypothetical protein PEX1_039570 [Penicillium expansum]KGO44613.1 hypothetical protein PEXP_021310 [Penicillium expansum]KGO56709.1 hypothetical protein PEX2_097880 [Penicillium expansum]
MSFLAVPLLKLGLNQAKKHKAKKDLQKYQNAGVYPPNYPQEQHPMSGYPAGATPGTTMHFESPPQEQSKSAKLTFMFFSGLRILQVIFGLTVMGMYGKDVHHDHSEKHTWHSKWVYALVTAFFAIITAAIHLILPFVMRKAKLGAGPGPALLLPQFAWEFVVTVLWLTLFGIFGKMYIGVHPVESSSSSSKTDTTTSALGDASKINRMRHAVWIDIINLVFWVMSASWILIRWLKSRRSAVPGDAIDAEKGGQI